MPFLFWTQNPRRWLEDNAVNDPSFYYAANLVKKILNIQKEFKGFLNDKFVELSANMELTMVATDTKL